MSGFFRTVGIFLLILHSNVEAAVQAVVDVDTARLQQGLNLTTDDPSIGLTIDWSGDNSLFSGLDCFASEGGASGLRQACTVYLGVFKPVSETRAWSFAAKHNAYSRVSGFDNGDYSELEFTWHASKQLSLSFSGKVDFLGISGELLAVQAIGRHPLRESWALSWQAGVAFPSGAARDKLDTVEFGQLGLGYNRQRWTTELRLVFSDSQLNRATKLEESDFQLGLSVSYQLY